jgi:predicted transcriptional regulator of viral defense system
MKFDDFIKKIANLPVIETEILLAGEQVPFPIEVQLSRWEKAGKLIQLKRGVYMLAQQYRKKAVCEPYIAAVIIKPSYISLEKALEHHHLIPEAVHIYTSLTPKRQGRFVTPVGVFDYRHIKASLFWGYESLEIGHQTAFMASAEKAILDLVYMNHIKVSWDYLDELRLQNVENINIDRLLEYAGRFHKPGILKAAGLIRRYVEEYKKGEKLL